MPHFLGIDICGHTSSADFVQLNCPSFQSPADHGLAAAPSVQGVSRSPGVNAGRIRSLADPTALAYFAAAGMTVVL